MVVVFNSIILNRYSSHTIGDLSALSSGSINVVYSSAPDENDPKWFYWTVHIETEPTILEDINEVIYSLHPTFSTQKIPVTNREEGFKIYAKGWGRFKLKIEIVSNGGSKMKIEYQMPTGEADSKRYFLNSKSFS